MKQVKDYLLKVLNKSKPSNEIDEKWRLLNEDQNLYQTYKDLVVGGAISAEEFWANRAVCEQKCFPFVYWCFAVGSN